jgi:hypothetical protein
MKSLILAATATQLTNVAAIQLSPSVHMLVHFDVWMESWL